MQSRKSLEIKVELMQKYSNTGRDPRIMINSVLFHFFEKHRNIWIPPRGYEVPTHQAD